MSQSMENDPDDHHDLAALSGLAPELASTLVMLASDIALVIDRDGVIRNVAEGEASVTPSAGDWVGRAWVDTVTADTRLKIEMLLDEVRKTGVSRRCEVIHPGASGLDIPMAYTAVRLGAHGPVLAVGRDLRAVAAIQQRFIDAQQEMERDYWQLRQTESRYRLLFQVATDAVLVVDASTLRVVEANEASCRLFGIAASALVGQRLESAIEPPSRSAVEELLVTAHSSERSAEIRVRLASGSVGVDISATPFRAETAHLLLVRARRVENANTTPGTSRAMDDFVNRTKDAVVITDSSGRILMANAAFASLAHVADAARLKGRPIAEALGDERGLVQAILTRVRKQGIVSQVTAQVHAASLHPSAVEISAALLAEGDQECIGLTLRRADARSASDGWTNGDAVLPGEELSAQLGLMSLPELLLEAGRRAEEHLVSAAMARSRGDRDAAAALLGITPESLSLRLHRLGVSLDPDDNGSPRVSH
jgi:transcriptional regulator PpsR